MEVLKKIRVGFWIGFTACVLSAINSCKKDTPVPVKTIIEHDTVQHAWQAEPEFNNRDQYVTTAYTNGSGKAFFYGEQMYWYIYDSIQKQWALGIYGTGPDAYDRPAVNSHFFAKEYFNSFGIENPYSSVVPIYGDSTKHLDSSFFLVPQRVNLPLTNIVDISDSDRIIFPVQTKDNPAKNGYYLIDAKQANPNANIIISNFHKLYLGVVNGINQLSSINHITNRFFASVNDSTYLIREDFSTKLVVPGEMFFSIFKNNGNYYATGKNGNIYETSDSGENWALKFTTNSSWLVIHNFDGKLIALRNDQLWEVNLGLTTISFKEIVNDGLTGKTITGLVKCNNKVWITTNGGVFYRTYSNLYQYK